VRLDEAGGQPDVGVHPLLVQPHRHAVAEGAHPAVRVARPGVVVDDPHGVDDLVAEHRPQLRLGVGPVGAGGHEHHDVVEVDQAVELLQQHRDHLLAGLGAGAVAGGDRDRLPGPESLAQRRPGDRLAQRPAQLGADVGGGRGGHRGDHLGRVGELDRQAGPAVREGHRAHRIRMPPRRVGGRS